MDVDLYYYRNPGQEPEQMINLYGEPYTSLPTAFAYRTAYAPPSCKTRRPMVGSTLVAQADGTKPCDGTYMARPRSRCPFATRAARPR